MSDETTPQDSEAMPPASAGSVCEPAAWGVCWSHDVLDCEFVYEHRDNAKAVAGEGNGSIVPLYRHPPVAESATTPTLTDAEREALEKAAWYVEAMAGGDLAGTIPPALRGLLERTK